jgi:hypothetical protein
MAAPAPAHPLFCLAYAHILRAQTCSRLRATATKLHLIACNNTTAKATHVLHPTTFQTNRAQVSVAVIDSLNLMRASIQEEVVMQSTLAVPAHQALACRIEAYGTPFA